MRLPLAKVTRHTKSHIHTVPAPIGGWNNRDAVANMPESDAVILDNYYPSVRDVRVRPGYDDHGNTLGAQVETLMPYLGPVTRKLIAAANGNLWDVTAAGAGSSIASGFSEDRWQHTMFGTAAGNYLCMVNGTDAYRTYDGTTLTAQVLTGVPEEDLIHVNSYKQRLFFVEKDSLSFWFLGAASIAGAATEFDVAPYARNGGHLVATATWTVDGGAGPDDYLVCITSEGEAIVYTGTDPASASAWSLVGVYSTGKPIGRRCFEQWGGELIIITQDGYMPMSAFLSGKGAIGATSDKIRDAVTAAGRQYSANFGWQVLFVPHMNMMLFNVPTNANGTESEQHIMNTITGAWARFTNVDATCWAVYEDELYFGVNAEVKHMSFDFTTDDGVAIESDVATAFNYMGVNGQKHLKMVRPVFSTDGTLAPAIKINLDFDTQEPGSPTVVVNPGLSLWDVSPWDTSSWGGVLDVQRQWLGATGIGYAASMRMKASTKSVNYAIQSIDYMFEPGGYL